MKDIMTDCSMTETRKAATEKWHEYKAAAKTYKDPIYADLQKVYNQVKNGQKVVDIHKVIAKGGVHTNFHPKLAVTVATSKKVFCTYSQNGTVMYRTIGNTWRDEKHAVTLKNCLPTFKMERDWQSLSLEAPVPVCPPKLLPAILTDDYYILWEVDVWKMVPPTDPYLLRRITKNMFVVLAGWDLTELEKACMAGRMY